MRRGAHLRQRRLERERRDGRLIFDAHGQRYRGLERVRLPVIFYPKSCVVVSFV
jgi:hypothetical protein